MKYQQRQASARLTLTPDKSALELHCSYDAGLIAELKASIPYQERTWDNNKKVWVISPKYGLLCASIVAKYLNIMVMVPSTQIYTEPQTRSIKLEYVGAVKTRPDGSESATGYSEGAWNVIFSLKVLKAWFEPDGIERPNEKTTLFGMLGISAKATDEEIKRAYRRLALQWHPDRCKEPDAKEQFIKIQSAYEILSDPSKRKKYQAGLAFEASLQYQSPTFVTDAYRPPLRCGWLLCEGVPEVGRFVVSKILGWEDITDDRNRTMITYWQAGDKHFTTEWI